MSVEPLSEQDRADTLADIRVLRAELERHEDTEPMPGMQQQHMERGQMFRAEIAKLEAQLAE